MTWYGNSWMWGEACALIDEAERRHRHFFTLLVGPTRPVWEPPVNIVAGDAELNVVVALPGARAEEIVVQLSGGHLAIETHVAPPILGAAANIVRLEIPYGRMRRVIDLPAGRYTLAERRLEDGCLHVTLRGPS